MKFLIVDDEKNIRKTLKIILSDYECSITESDNISDAKTLIDNEIFDVAIIDIRLPDGSGLEILKYLKSLSSETVVLIITAFSSTETAIDAMKAGAYDYITKPFNLDEIRIIIKNIVEKISLQKKIKNLEHYQDAYQNIIGKSLVMRKVFNMIDKIAPFDTNVIIIGESGTGKELVAKAIHNKSRRSYKPYITINCASFPSELLESELFGYTKGAFTGAYTSKRGLIEEANNGTLFLDEIAEMPISLQAKLLRFLEEKKIRPLGSNNEVPVDVRIIAATNRDFLDLLKKGDFREDLYFRLATFEIKLPSLSERKEDIPLLIDHFVKVLSKKFNKEIIKIDPVFIDTIMQMELRGNVRELKNIIEREIILSEDGCLRFTPPHPLEVSYKLPFIEIPDSGLNLEEYLTEIEKNLLEKALLKANGVKTKAAELLGLTFREFRYKLSKYKKFTEKENE
ncbi:MAG: sigma-54 dependent transcriptional regulator [Thermodesulfovibrionales bacterium]|nr:sigma-54 dependent transcriptional regulator [Thermodesulfovibrionales bacterium]